MPKLLDLKPKKEVSPKIDSKPVIKEENKEISKIITIDSIHDITSDQLRTAYFLITGKSTRKTKSEIKKELMEFLKKNFEE